MMTPTIHLNGTSREALLTQCKNAKAALHNAYDAMREAQPNARDYYPQGDGAFKKAQQEHLERLARVQALMSEYAIMMEEICDHPGK